MSEQELAKLSRLANEVGLKITLSLDGPLKRSGASPLAVPGGVDGVPPRTRTVSDPGEDP